MSARRGFRYEGGPPTRDVAERMLAVPTGLLRAAEGRNPALAGLDLDAALEELEHDWIPYRGLTLHLERHEVGAEAPTVIIVHGLGDHARRQTPLAAALAARGWNVLSLDRQGHGLSEGRRGDATLDADFGALETVTGLARARYSGPVVVLGDSLGGIMTWFALTREPDIDAAVCHGVRHPEVNAEPGFAAKAALLRAVARVAPFAPISVRRLADYDHVALDPITKAYFDDELDELFNFSVTARAAASYLGFRPAIPWERVEIPVLVIIGGEDRMLPPRFTRQCVERARPPATTFVEIATAGHQLFLDDLGLALDPLLGWLDETLAASRPGAAR